MILITAPVHPHLPDTLKKKGYEVVYEPLITYTELSEKIENATGLVVTTRLPIDATLIDKASNLKWIGRLGSGMELIDADYAARRNIKCVSSPEGNRNAVAEHCLGLLLCLEQNIMKSSREVSEGNWLREENRGTEIFGKTIGLVGYGNTGEAFARILSGFKPTILAFDKYRYGFGKGLLKEANLEQICRYADVISFHVPLTDETRHMANADFFDSLKKKPVLLNTSRGAVVDTQALVDAVRDGKISGAGLDVLENEKLTTLNASEKERLSFLANHPRVVITPHIAGYTHEAFLKMSEILIKKLKL